jgi:hypothetical protein
LRAGAPKLANKLLRARLQSAVTRRRLADSSLAAAATPTNEAGPKPKAIWQPNQMASVAKCDYQAAASTGIGFRRRLLWSSSFLAGV